MSNNDEMKCKTTSKKLFKKQRALLSKAKNAEQPSGAALPKAPSPPKPPVAPVASGKNPQGQAAKQAQSAARGASTAPKAPKAPKMPKMAQAPKMPKVGKSEPTNLSQPPQEDLSDQYEKLLRNHYPEDFVKQVLRTDEHSSGWLGGPAKHEKHGNLIVKYAEGPQKLGIMGLFSSTGRVRPSDAQGLKNLIGRVRSSLDSGKEVYVSLNQHSGPLFQRALKGGDFNIQDMGSFEYPFGKWKTVKVTKALRSSELNKSSKKPSNRQELKLSEKELYTNCEHCGTPQFTKTSTVPEYNPCACFLVTKSEKFVTLEKTETGFELHFNDNADPESVKAFLLALKARLLVAKKFGDQ